MKTKEKMNLFVFMVSVIAGSSFMTGGLIDVRLLYTLIGFAFLVVAAIAGISFIAVDQSK